MSPSLQMRSRLETEIAALREAGTPHAVATVVRTVGASAVRPGDKALIHADGTLGAGWLGGGCTRGAVAKAAREAIETGVPQLVALRPQDLLEATGAEAETERDGLRYARNNCPSRGSVDVFIEPSLAQPRLTVCGGGPVALALIGLAASLDLHRTLRAPDFERRDCAEPDAFMSDFEAEAPVPDYVVVATQGRGDEAALTWALQSGAAHIAFVGSRTKFAALGARLGKDGLDTSRVQAPAGLAIGAVTPEEIALSVLAQIVSWRRTPRTLEAK